ncbi:Heme-binding 2, partial [Brachionus plicatilis]
FLVTLIEQSMANEKPDYEILSSIDNTSEMRKYLASKWVSTSTTADCSNLDSERSVMFGRLFRYITGQNDKNQKIQMTAPVLNEIKKLDGQKCLFTMRFYIPKANQVNTPVPTGNAVLTDMPEFTVAATRFGGFASMNDYMQHDSQLKQQLISQLNKFDTQTIITAGYNSPFEFADRINEVWIKKL